MQYKMMPSPHNVHILQHGNFQSQANHAVPPGGERETEREREINQFKFTTFLK